uniref:RxLR effector candidate protein n=1 Tax=Hyaloperonospora arabidopsidis (strain Emoy2) TaxID=559515 RepID=M4BV02_HYAAE
MSELLLSALLCSLPCASGFRAELCWLGLEAEERGRAAYATPAQRSRALPALRFIDSLPDGRTDCPCVKSQRILRECREPEQGRERG